MTALRSTLAELRTGATDGSTAALLTEESAALLEYIGRLERAVLAVEDQPDTWRDQITGAAAEIRQLEKP